MKILQLIRDWSEVWPLLLPLTVIILKRPGGNRIGILVGYVITAFFLNLLANLMVEFYYLVPASLHVKGMVNNNLLYNIHSIVRVLLLSWYIMSVRSYRFPIFLYLLLCAYVIFVVYHFVDSSPLFLSSYLYAAESGVLLVMSLFYFFHSIQDEGTTNWLKHPSFLVCAGVCLYEVITFFIFLFFYPLSEQDQAFFVVSMRIYNIAFIMLCIMFALALYRSRRRSGVR